MANDWTLALLSIVIVVTSVNAFLQFSEIKDRLKRLERDIYGDEKKKRSESTGG